MYNIYLNGSDFLRTGTLDYVYLCDLSYFYLLFVVDKFKQIFSLRCCVETTGYKSYSYCHNIICICTDVRVSYKNNNISACL